MLSSIFIVAMTPFFIAPVDINVRTHLEGDDMERIEHRDALYVRCVVANKFVVAIVENNGGKTGYRPVKGKRSYLAHFVFEHKIRMSGKQLDLTGIV